MAAKVFNLTITSDLRQYPYKKRYPTSMTLQELKELLQLVVGSSIECMRTELYDKDGKFVSSLTDDQTTLENLGMTDRTPTCTLLYNPISYGNVATVGKYMISEEKYDERKDSLRAWKRREGLKIKYDALAAT
ncbi:unnamed protein product, partial [Onchocerca ochengi]|uniref:Ubiquitin-like domain-containing protein n=1 Tax=Onchocerca ochengi TaxID=42157 RepID=A0A182EX11_ONCOC